MDNKQTEEQIEHDKGMQRIGDAMACFDDLYEVVPEQEKLIEEGLSHLGMARHYFANSLEEELCISN